MSTGILFRSPSWTVALRLAARIQLACGALIGAGYLVSGGLNGRQLAEAARRTRPGLRVLFITGYAHNAASGNGGILDPGMEIITKPFALDTLAAKIREMIEET